MTALELCLPDMLMAINEPGGNDLVCAVDHFSNISRGDVRRYAGDGVAGDE